jgi:hypothetical protein
MTYMQNDLAVGGIQELSLSEIDEVNGAIGPLVILAVAAVVVVGAAFVAGVVDGASGAKKQTQ